MSSVSTNICSAISRRPEIAGLLLCAALTGCSTLYEPADVIETQVHRGADVLDFDAASKTLASGGWEGELVLWSMPEGSPKRTWQAHEGSIKGLGFAGRFVVSAGRDARLVVWSRDGKSLEQVDTGVAVVDAAVSERYVVTGHKDGTVRVWELPKLRLRKKLSAHTGAVRAVAIHAETGRFASVGIDKRVYVWDAASSPRALQPAPGDTRSLAFSPDGSTLYGGAWFNLLRWEVERGQLQVLPTQHWGVISGLQYVPSLDVLATISRVNDSSVYFLEPDSGSTVRTFAPQRLCGSAISLSPNGRFLATTGDDGAVRIWDLDEGGS